MTSTTLFIIDGCRPDVLADAATPNIDRLAATGSSTMQATTVSPSITLPAHFSIFTSLKPIDHGVLTNAGQVNHYSHHCNIITLARAAGMHTSVFTNWEFLRELTPAGVLNCSLHLDNCREPDGDLEVAEAAAAYLEAHPGGFSFVYFGCPDEAGHEFGFGSDEYRRRLETADRALGRVLKVLERQMTPPNILLLSDHGGFGNHHGEDRPENQTIPWMAAGTDVKTGHSISCQVSVLDTAPTLARFLGLPLHPLWKGLPVNEIWV